MLDLLHSLVDVSAAPVVWIMQQLGAAEETQETVATNMKGEKTKKKRLSRNDAEEEKELVLIVALANVDVLSSDESE